MSNIVDYVIDRLTSKFTIITQSISNSQNIKYKSFIFDAKNHKNQENWIRHLVNSMMDPKQIASNKIKVKRIKPLNIRMNPLTNDEAIIFGTNHFYDISSYNLKSDSLIRYYNFDNIFNYYQHRSKVQSINFDFVTFRWISDNTRNNNNNTAYFQNKIICICNVIFNLDSIYAVYNCEKNCWETIKYGILNKITIDTSHGNDHEEPIFSLYNDYLLALSKYDILHIYKLSQQTHLPIADQSYKIKISNNNNITNQPRFKFDSNKFVYKPFCLIKTPNRNENHFTLCLIQQARKNSQLQKKHHKHVQHMKQHNKQNNKYQRIAKTYDSVCESQSISDQKSCDTIVESFGIFLDLKIDFKQFESCIIGRKYSSLKYMPVYNSMHLQLQGISASISKHLNSLKMIRHMNRNMNNFVINNKLDSCYIDSCMVINDRFWLFCGVFYKQSENGSVLTFDFNQNEWNLSNIDKNIDPASQFEFKNFLTFVNVDIRNNDNDNRMNTSSNSEQDCLCLFPKYATSFGHINANLYNDNSSKYNQMCTMISLRDIIQNYDDDKEFSWQHERVLWIGFYKNKTNDLCLIDNLSKSVILAIVAFVAIQFRV